MDELLGEIVAEKQKISTTLDQLEKILRRNKKEFVELAAMD
ncbi:MAG: hypothetical protein ACE5IW_03855 [bacterium]